MIMETNNKLLDVLGIEDRAHITEVVVTIRPDELPQVELTKIIFNDDIDYEVELFELRPKTID